MPSEDGSFLLGGGCNVYARSSLGSHDCPENAFSISSGSRATETSFTIPSDTPENNSPAISRLPDRAPVPSLRRVDWTGEGVRKYTFAREHFSYRCLMTLRELDLGYPCQGLPFSTPAD
jgi:hypothetical protein